MVSNHTKLGASLVFSLVIVTACQSTPEQPDDGAALVALGERVFFTETFDGNGRTCGTCHRREDNFGLSPAFIATLPRDDALFVAERRKSLSENFEKPAQMRERGLILENQDGFDDLTNNFNLRGVPHVLGLATSVASQDGPRTGWSGDGAPGDGSLRAFSTGAVIQHFPKTLARVAGVDFRLPTNTELDAMEAFMLSLGRQRELALPLALADAEAARGQRVFLDNRRGKCNVCHANAGANVDEELFGIGAGNLNFNTGVQAVAGSPVDDGFGNPGNNEFNTPSLVEAADTEPFFHNNSAPTLEVAVAFYNTAAFNDSPAGRTIASRTGGPIALSGRDVVAVTTFLRVINALENIRSSRSLLQEAEGLANARSQDWQRPLAQARFETDDAIEVLTAANVHRAAIRILGEARGLVESARRNRRREGAVRNIGQALARYERAQAELVSGRSI